MLSDQEKHGIAEQANRYLSMHKLSQSAFSKMVEVDKAYLSNMLNGRLEIKVGNDRQTVIDDVYWLRIRRFLDGDEFILRSKNYVEINGVLAYCKGNHKFKVVDGETGAGKSFACEKFHKKNPHETYLVRCADDLGCKEFMELLGIACGVGSEGTRASIRQRVVDKIKREKNPLIIIDEAENLKDGVYGAIKAIADDLKDIAGIVLIGANKQGRGYFDWLRNSATRKRGCFPQIFSRFKANALFLSSLSYEDIVQMSESYGFENPKLHQQLLQTCENYRDLAETLKEYAHRRDMGKAKGDVSPQTATA